MARRAGGNATSLSEMISQGLFQLISWVRRSALSPQATGLYLETVYPLAGKGEISKGIQWINRAINAADMVANSAKRINYQNFPAGGPVTPGNRYVFDTVATFVGPRGARKEFRTQVNSPRIMTATEIEQAFRKYWNDFQRDKYDEGTTGKPAFLTGNPVSITIIAAWRA